GRAAGRAELRAGAYALLLAPLLLGLLVPARPAGAALIDPQQLNTAGGRGYRGANVLATDDSRGWTLYDWMFARYTLAPEQLTGRPVDVVGFVYRAPDQPADEFYVTRYVMACCIADRSGTSLVVRSPDAAALAPDSWVRVSGSVALRPAQPPELVVADAQVQRVPQPAEPYLYP
ncbi:MAG TPA: TIGR03943 family protein, partial [Roseiflexaceae bacterium]|nr:TIGR03943 family protein [Roseiflexaceae bacterium]